jgi:hypothetical protein
MSCSDGFLPQEGFRDMIRNKTTGLLVLPHDGAWFGPALLNNPALFRTAVEVGRKLPSGGKAECSLLQQTSRAFRLKEGYYTNDPKSRTCVCSVMFLVK